MNLLSHKNEKLILWFEEINNSDVELVGGKGASLGEMYNNLTHLGVNVPNGFCITAKAYSLFVGSIEEQISIILNDYNLDNNSELREAGEKIRNLILKQKLPQILEDEISSAYKSLNEHYNTHNLGVAVRSSATKEDLEDASFAGQQESYLDRHGIGKVLEACKLCFASLFTDRAIKYREEKNFEHDDVKLSITVQKMVQSSTGSSGIIFTIEPTSGRNDHILITSSYGIGEYVVGGKVNPDEFMVFKPSLTQGFMSLYRKTLGTKLTKLEFNNGKHEEIKVSRSLQKDYSIQEYEVNQLAKWALIIEQHYSNLSGKNQSVDIEWTKDGLDGQLYIVQARPETVYSQVKTNTVDVYELKTSSPNVLVTGVSACSKISQGKVRILNSYDEGDLFQKGEVLVTRATDPNWNTIMSRASAIITAEGGRTCHAAIIAREKNICTVVGVGEEFLSQISNHDEVTVHAKRGAAGYVYDGIVPFEVKQISFDHIKAIKTKIYANLADPDDAMDVASLPCDGIGLLRSEFIANEIGIHPSCFEDYYNLPEDIREKISAKTRRYSKKSQYYVEKFSEGIAAIATAMYPRPVIVRLSDFKSNEYRKLIGGNLFEPHEENPMLGYRGASRYITDKFRFAFDLECEALKRVRLDMNLTNVAIMVPFCRTPEEGKKVVEILELNGLVRGENGLAIYVMAELPTNCLRAKEFCKVFDGFSIGSNDLTQLTLGIDRDSGLVANTFDENDPAVRSLIQELFRQVREYEKETGESKYIGVCGQGPSDSPEFANFLVSLGIDSLSLTPDSILETRDMISHIES